MQQVGQRALSDMSGKGNRMRGDGIKKVLGVTGEHVLFGGSGARGK